MSARQLIISDLQVPFHVKDSLEFCLYVAKHHRIPKDEVYCVGDETDGYFASAYEKDPDAQHSPVSEIEETIEELHRWYKAFPRLRLCNSNHQQRWGNRAKRSGIPARLIRPYSEVIEAPEGWIWADEWVVPVKHRYLIEHGHVGPQGKGAYVRRTIDNAMSTVQGHDHSDAGTQHIRLRRQELWGMNVGCLMDTDSYAAAYGKEMRTRPVLSVGVVLDDGKTPLVVPYG